MIRKSKDQASKQTHTEREYKVGSRMHMCLPFPSLVFSYRISLPDLYNISKILYVSIDLS